MKVERPEEKYPQGHPSEDRTGRHSLDQLIRSKGFQIHSRPKIGPTLWVKNGKLYTQIQALNTIEPGLVKTAKHLQELYYKGRDGECQKYLKL